MACSDATGTPAETFAATLSGGAEVPANTSTASGTAMLTLTGNTLTYEVAASGFATPLVVAHIVIGGVGAVGPVIVPFDVIAQQGVVARGTVDLSGPVSYNTLSIPGDSLATLLRNGLTYVNLHTAAWPGGEIRGQIVPR